MEFVSSRSFGRNGKSMSKNSRYKVISRALPKYQFSEF